MPMLDRLRSSLFGQRKGPAVYKCRSCDAYFSKPGDVPRSEVECPFCGSGTIRSQR